MAQTVQPDEIIVVDDGSDEEHNNFLGKLLTQYPIKILTQENAGQSAARNLGVRESTSEFVCILDQDDYFLPQHIKDLLEIADLNDPRFAFSYGDLWRETESGLVVSHSVVNLENQHPLTDLATLVGSNMYILPSATLIRRDSFLEIGGYDVELRGYEDDDLFLRFFMSGFSNRFTSKPVTVWTINTSSTSFSESMARSRFIYFKKLVQAFPEGSVFGVQLFGNYMYKRFAYQFAADVIEAALKGLDSFQERVERLRHYQALLGSSKEVSARTKRKFMFVTKPLVKLSSVQLKLLLRLVLASGLLSVFTFLEGRGEFVRRYLPQKIAP
jgi:glycosyltransferase involved in cell wall biosynthesis